MKSILLAILFLAFASASNAQTPPSTWWIALSFVEQSTYLEGYIDGQVEVAVYVITGALGSTLTPDQTQVLLSMSPREIDRPVLMTAIREFYRDPANTYVQFSHMLQIVADKIRGKQIDDQLRRAREAGLRWHEYIKRK